MKKAIIIDGNSLIYRMFHASYKQLEYYKQNNLLPLNAVTLTVSSCLKLLNNKKYDYAIVAFDSAKKSFRNELLTEYKQTRKKMPEELIVQLPIIKDFLNDIGFNTINIEGIEADDIIGSLSKKFSSLEIVSDIFTSDKDMLQLVDNNIVVNLIKKGVSDILENNINNFQSLNNNLTPKQIIDFKAIAGDSSDNFKGVKGIGEKTAIDLLLKFNNLQNIYNHLDELRTCVKNKFLNNKDSAYLCYELATIKTDYFDKDFNDQLFTKKEINKQKIDEKLNKYKLNILRKYF